MMKRLAVLLLAALPALGQSIDPLRNVSGTAANPGASTTLPWVTSAFGGWTFFHGFTAHVTNTTEIGPDERRNEVFSTNWFAAGLRRNIGDRAFLILRGRVSAEPFTIPEDEGYPQMLQYVSADGGGPLVDRMRPQDFFGEAAVHAGIRLGGSSMVHVYAAAVGDPAFGPPPFALRSSGLDFAEAPFSYDIAETTHDATSVITAGFDTRLIGIEGSVFHEAVTLGDHTEVDDGDIDSSSVRVTLRPTETISIQASRATLGEDLAEREVSSASISFGTNNVAATALWARREREGAPTETAYGFEITARGTRNTIMGRAEWVGRPIGFPEIDAAAVGTEQTTHFAVGYLFDFISGPRLRAGVGVNIDYHTQSHELPGRYGHKPQTIYAFVRLRNGG